MDFDELKIFLYGLPLDCQESTLKDFLEGMYTTFSFLRMFTLAYRSLLCPARILKGQYNRTDLTGIFIYNKIQGYLCIQCTFFVSLYVLLLSSNPKHL